MKGTQLHPIDRAAVLNRFPYRMTVESIQRWPDAAKTMRDGGFRCPIITDAEWLECTHFKVRKDGRLDARASFCECNRPIV